MIGNASINNQGLAGVDGRGIALLIGRRRVHFFNGPQVPNHSSKTERHRP